MAELRFRREPTASFLERLAAIETFLEEADAADALDRLRGELRATILPNLARFPRMGRRYLDQLPQSAEALAQLEAFPSGAADARRPSGSRAVHCANPSRTRVRGTPMSLFASILEKLGFGDRDAPPTSALAAVPSSTAALTPVDVIAKLEALAAVDPQKRIRKVSIVHLLKPPGLDRSLAARKELATALGGPTDKTTDSAQVNGWLHKTLMPGLAGNGGNVPNELR